ncbi:uncharacterized protein GGS22DRAFT_47639 [Annulohypoxylon maeteangense]|uniref:uncharacterized protein n=1 Tax=Annulohypoxylon maeteangense TaxID=1927788 RepID=UPI0020088802|nr:uncharacterized protein GGS22DRAFT_47639 [Annulohypoxylon maeteangense]KAI0882666.1 hypothetical protein GGS22DRAFT_47639 [Annulohypoxylon maeteangense]
MTTNNNLVFRITYTSIFFLLCLVLIALLLVVPGDFIRQVLFTSKRYINLIVLAIVVVITLLIILFIYALRLYVTRTVLASIPKTWIPTEKGDAPKEVRKMIATDLSRSAAIAWGAYPKVITPPTRAPSPGDKAEEAMAEGNMKDERKSLQLFRSKPPTTVEEKMGILLPSLRPVWGEVEHDGWGSPNSPDLPNLQYSNVISELPNLIEAKAVTQAPPDPDSIAIPPTLDADAVALLRRSSCMTMRDYVTHLMNVGVLPSSQDAFSFIDNYERARFSTRPLSNAHFRHLMHLFAELLRSIRPLDTGSIYHGTEDAYSESDGHIDDDAPHTTPTTPARSNSTSISLRSGSSTRSRALRPNLGGRNSSSHTWNQYRTAPTTPRSKAGGKGLSHTSSTNSGSSFAQTRRIYAASHTSSSSLRSASQTSIIRLATREDRSDLPYVLRIGEAY